MNALGVFSLAKAVGGGGNWRGDPTAAPARAIQGQATKFRTDLPSSFGNSTSGISKPVPELAERPPSCSYGSTLNAEANAPMPIFGALACGFADASFDKPLVPLAFTAATL